MRAIVWFRQDLRLDDQAPLREAVALGGEIYPLYIFDPSLGGKWALGAAAKAWLHQSLDALQSEIPLTFYKGETLECLTRAIKESRATHLFFTKGRGSHERALEKSLLKHFPDIEVRGFDDAYLIDPTQVLNQQGEPYQMFTPFYRAALHAVESQAEKAPKGFKAKKLKSLALNELGLMPEGLDWADSLLSHWHVGEKAAHKKAALFIKDKLRHYGRERDRIDLESTSQLSPHLRWGEVSIRRLYEATKGSEKFRAELFWREFAAYLLFHFPHFPNRSFREEFEGFAWQDERSLLNAWKRGETGVPIVDAAMRCLWATGWMHNRARMIVASFLTKNLLIPWQKGEAWFWDTLVDADLANNSVSWQWVAGTGVDAAPYFRIFNPILQAEKFDPEGTFIRTWVPELKHLKAPLIFFPPEEVRKGRYIEPIIDLKESRERALSAYKKLKR